MDVFIKRLMDAFGFIVNGPQNVEFDFFQYAFPNFTALAANASQTQSVTIQADADFECHSLFYQSTTALAVTTANTMQIPNYNAMLIDTGSGRRLADNPVPIASLASNALCQRMLPGGPRIFRRNGTIQLTLTNIDVAVVTTVVQVSMLGRKCYAI